MTSHPRSQPNSDSLLTLEQRAELDAVLIASLKARIQEMEGALRNVMQRANEGRGDQMSMNETIYALHRIALDALQPKDSAK